MEKGSGDRIDSELVHVLASEALSALLPPCPAWPDLN
jgi:hypothetical protein